MPERVLSLFLAGDALMTRPWSQADDPAFIGLVAQMRAADVTIVNLETVIHEFQGFAQADSGGAYMASPPEIASELKWAGVDMVSHANNHAFDYGSTGILETLEHVKAAGLILAGSGKDLQDARAPRYLVCEGGTAALVAMASDFVPYGKASRSRPDLHGRPGLNPLTLTKGTEVTITRTMSLVLREFYRLRGRSVQRFKNSSFMLRGKRFRIGKEFAIAKGPRLAASDLGPNLLAIHEAASQSDVTVVSLHAHRQGKWLRDFAHQAIAEGADVVFVHGPHQVRAIELRSGKPIFYGMGNFVVEYDQISRLPAEAYEPYGLGDDSTAADLLRVKKHLWPSHERDEFEAFAAALQFRDGKAIQIRLLPLDLQFGAPDEIRGRPRYADSRLGMRIIDRVAGLSKEYGTRIEYDAEANCGIVIMDR